MRSTFRSLRFILIYFFPLVLYFSYYPRLSLGSSASTNYELSLPLIWLLLFSLLSLPPILAKFKTIYAQTSARPYLLLAALFPLYLCLSLIWSPNPLRALLTAGIFLCLIISASAIYLLKDQLDRTLLRRVFLVSALFAAGVCWLQACLDAFLPYSSVSSQNLRDFILLCPNCGSAVFGFPHPSGFAIEPQFMGNLLLAPTLYAFYLYLSSTNSTQRLRFALIFTFLLTTLCLIFSRGALYACALGLIGLLLTFLLKRFCSPKRTLGAVGLCLLSLVFCLSAQVFFATYNRLYRTDSSCALATSLSQLSLDLIHLNYCTISPAEPMTSTNPESASVLSPSVDSESTSAPASSSTSLSTSETALAPAFSGYVSESTNIRLELNRAALALSLRSPTSFLFGYGLGSAGSVLYSYGKTASAKEIVQNEYFSLLLETGCLGLLCLLALLFSLRPVFKQATLSVAARYFLLFLVLAQAFSLIFFSGLPNALHLYLFPVYLFILLLPNPVSSRTQTCRKLRN